PIEPAVEPWSANGPLTASASGDEATPLFLTSTVSGTETPRATLPKSSCAEATEMSALAIVTRSQRHAPTRKHSTAMNARTCAGIAPHSGACKTVAALLLLRWRRVRPRQGEV